MQRGMSVKDTFTKKTHMNHNGRVMVTENHKRVTSFDGTKDESQDEDRIRQCANLADELRAMKGFQCLADATDTADKPARNSEVMLLK